MPDNRPCERCAFGLVTDNEIWLLVDQLDEIFANLRLVVHEKN